jgi:hypothetical protein
VSACDPVDACEPPSWELPDCELPPGAPPACVLLATPCGDTCELLTEPPAAGEVLLGALGCSGPLGCGIDGPLLPAAAVRARESSPRLMVYDLNGGSSDEGAAAAVGAGADRPFGPDNSSGTNNTIRTTRMIAPVSRSFTRVSKMGTNSPLYN